MNNKVDLLFKRTLENHRIAPGEKAWNAIEGRLLKKNKNYLWVRVAASLLLCALLVVFWTKPTHQKTASNTLAVNGPEATMADTEQKEVKENTVNETDGPTQPMPKRQPRQEHLYQKINSQSVVAADLSGEKLTSNELKPQVSMPVAEKPAFDEAQINKQYPNIGQSMVLVYSLPAIEPKADKPDARVETPKTEKHNNLKKVLELASDLRTGESNLNSVRQTKNEILAFNFMKNEKNN